MKSTLLTSSRQPVNASRFDPASTAGFYESYFVRANHPTRPLAFWIRYTIFRPRGNSNATEGQLWAIYFDGEASSVLAAKQSLPLAECLFSNRHLEARIGAATLNESALQGSVSGGTHRLSWDLQYKGDHSPTFLLPLAFYNRGFPKAKVLTGIPLADFTGTLIVNDQNIDVTNWHGSQNHNWGEKHTDSYAWGQVAGFDTDPTAFLECSTARLKVGPLWTPWFTNLVLRVGDREFKLNSLFQAMRNKGRYNYFKWTVECHQGPVHIAISIEAPANRFAGLAYDDPPGGKKHCLNTKLASCTVHLTVDGQAPLTLHTESRAAFEVLTSATDHVIPIMA